MLPSRHIRPWCLYKCIFLVCAWSSCGLYENTRGHFQCVSFTILDSSNICAGIVNCVYQYRPRGGCQVRQSIVWVTSEMRYRGNLNTAHMPLQINICGRDKQVVKLFNWNKLYILCRLYSVAISCCAFFRNNAGIAECYTVARVILNGVTSPCISNVRFLFCFLNLNRRYSWMSLNKAKAFFSFCVCFNFIFLS